MFFSKSPLNNKCLVVLHIPKTAGTTFRYILSRQYSKGNILNIYENQKKYKKQAYLKELSEEKKSRFEVIVGHFGMQLKEFFPKNSHCFTFLRDPLDLVMSTYNHNMNLNDKWINNQISFSEFLSLDNININNRQTRMLSGFVTKKIVSQELMFDAALKNIEEKFVMVGLSDMFDESIFMLSSILSWRPPYYVRENVSIRNVDKFDLSEEDIETVNNLNSLDVRLYSHVKELFLERWNEENEEFHDKFKVFLDQNNDYSVKNKPKVVWK